MREKFYDPFFCVFIEKRKKVECFNKIDFSFDFYDLLQRVRQSIERKNVGKVIIFDFSSVLMSQSVSSQTKTFQKSQKNIKNSHQIDEWDEKPSKKIFCQLSLFLMVE